METLTLAKPKGVTWDYDAEGDTLYISFGKPQPALTMDMGSGLLARYQEKTGKLIGFTLVGVREVLKLDRVKH